MAGTTTRSAVRIGEATTAPAATRHTGRSRAAAAAGRAPVRAASPRNSGQAGAPAAAAVAATCRSRAAASSAVA